MHYRPVMNAPASAVSLVSHSDVTRRLRAAFGDADSTTAILLDLADWLESRCDDARGAEMVQAFAIGFSAHEAESL